MQWEVTGADTTTGEDRKIVIEADDAASATRRGNRAGLMVAGVRPIPATQASAPIGAGPTNPPPLRARPVLGTPPAPNLYATPVEVMPYAGADSGGGGGVNGLAVASLSVGSVAAVLGIVPCFGMLGIPLAIVGLGLGIAGWIVGFSRRRQHSGLAIAGTATSAVAIVIPIAFAVYFFHSIAKAGAAAQAQALAQAQAQQARSQAQFQQTQAQAQMQASMQAAQAQMRAQQAQANAQMRAQQQAQGARPGSRQSVYAPTSAPTATLTAMAGTPVDFGSDAVVGDATVKIVSAVIGVADAVNISGQTAKSDAPCLMVKITVKNTSASKRLVYRPAVGSQNSPDDGNIVRLADDSDEIVQRYFFPPGFKPVGHADPAPIAPGAELTDVLVFVAPPVAATDLKLFLPERSIGSHGIVCLDLPVTSITRQ